MEDDLGWDGERHVAPIFLCEMEGQAQCISQTCAKSMDRCMTTDVKLMMDAALEDTIVDTTAEDVCAETWSKLFLMSGSGCVLAGIVF